MITDSKRFIVQGVNTISRPAQQYVGWPTVCSGKDGKIYIICSGGRQRHVCPFGQIHLIESDDQGKTWSWHRVIYDGPLDDRDAGILHTNRGTLLATWFTSLTWELFLDERPHRIDELPADEKTEWLRHRRALSDDVRMSELGCWLIRSTDNGQTWSSKIDTVAGSPHGPLQLSNGYLLYPGVQHAGNQYGAKRGPFSGRPGASLSKDDGVSWHWSGDIPAAINDKPENYHELHGVEADDGRVIVHIRNHNPGPHFLELLQTESVDHGQTWSIPKPTGIWGRPGHLLKLKSGQLLSSSGHRREPFGIHITMSDDQGQSWQQQCQLAPTNNADFGYPSTVELDDHSLLTVWYELQENQNHSVLRSARWNLS